MKSAIYIQGMASLQSLAEEATNGSNDAGEELDKKIEEALACPCVDDLREGACGSQFTQAFTCYIKNMKADKLGDCYPKFEAMHRCMGDNPQSFSKYGQESQLAGAAIDGASKPG